MEAGLVFARFPSVLCLLAPRRLSMPCLGPGSPFPEDACCPVLRWRLPQASRPPGSTLGRGKVSLFLSSSLSKVPA